MAKMLKILLIGIAAFVVVDAFAFDGAYRVWFVRTCVDIWYTLNNLDWVPSRR